MVLPANGCVTPNSSPIAFRRRQFSRTQSTRVFIQQSRESKKEGLFYTYRARAPNCLSPWHVDPCDEGTKKESTHMPLKIIIDTDPAQDDADALLLALAFPDNLEILAVVTVAGNVSLSHTTANARQVLELAGRSDLP